MKFVDPDTKTTVLDLTSGQHVPVVGEFNGKSLKANIVKTPRIVSHDKEDLNIVSQQGIDLIGKGLVVVFLLLGLFDMSVYWDSLGVGEPPVGYKAFLLFLIRQLPLFPN